MALILDGTNGLSDVDGSASTPAIRGTDTNTGIFFPAADTIGFAEGGVEAMRIDSSGNVGIGTSSPSGRLQVTSPAGASFLIGFNNTSVNYLDANTNIFRTGSFVETMRIDSSGNVGIGTSSPYAPANYGNLTINGTNGGTVSLFTNGTRSFTAYSTTSNVVMGSVTSVPLVLTTGDTERMRIDSSGNVLIGTSDASGVNGLKILRGSGDWQLLKLLNSGAGGGAFVNTQNATTAGIGWDFGVPGSSADFIWRYNTTERMRLDSSGNLGLGVTPSAWVGSARAIQLGQYTSLALDSNGSTAVSSNAYESAAGTWRYSATLGASRYSSEFGAHKWFTAPSGTAGNAISFTQAMTLDASGNLLVGATSPSYANTNRGNITIGGSQAILAFRINGNNAGYLYHDTSTMLLATDLNVPMQFNTNGTERMRINSSGTLLVGATLATFTMPSTGGASFKASSTGGGVPIVEIGNTDTTSSSDSSPALICFKGSATTSSTARFIQFSASGTATTMGAIVGNGSGVCQFANFSDIKLKKNIAPMSGSLTKILSLKPCSYDLIADDTHVNAGFIAQDVKTVYPEYVIENMSDEGQEPLMGLTGGMTGGIIAELVCAIQELKAELDTVKAELNQLKGV